MYLHFVKKDNKILFISIKSELAYVYTLYINILIATLILNSGLYENTVEAQI